MTGGNYPMVPVQDAIRTVLYQTAKVLVENPPKQTTVSLKTNQRNQLLHQTLATDVIMPEPGYPPYRASIMDGYAVQTTTSKKNRGKEWTHCVQAKVFAGDAVKKLDGESSQDLQVAYYVTTGAVVPDEFDCVVPIEKCIVSADGTFVSLSDDATVESGKWIRQVGCDTPAGSVVLERGHVLDPVSIGLLLQLRVSEVRIRCPIRVGVLSTGNELLGPDEYDTSLQQLGRIPDVNRPILLCLLSEFGPWCMPIDLGIERDDNVPHLTQVLESALDECDVIISTGGISMGESDVMEHVLVEKLGGRIHFGRLHMKPGKPTTFVTISKPNCPPRLFFAMPGNPVSATVCTHLLVKPCANLLYNGPDSSADKHGESLEEMLNRTVDNAWLHPEVTARLTHDAKLDTERPEYHRVSLTVTKDGSIEATSTGIQQSSRLLSLRDAQGLLVLPQGVAGGKTKALKGEEYTVLLLTNDSMRRVQLCNSIHINKKSHKSFRIGVVHVVAPGTDEDSDLQCVTDQVRTALSGTKSGPATITSAQSFSGRPKEIFDVLLAGDNVDLHVVTCAIYPGSFRANLEFSTQVCQRLDKIADALALQIRRGAACEDPTASLFETVVGYIPNGRGSIVVCLADDGLVGGLQNVRGLLKHALQVARPNQTCSNDYRHFHAHSI
jgi:molybdenum cofactor synthesis domain-containing protein